MSSRKSSCGKKEGRKTKMKKLAPCMVILAAVFWGCLGCFVRILSQYGFSSLDLVAIRMVGAFVLMFVFLLIYNRKLLRIRYTDIWCFLGTGVVSIVFFNYCYFTTIQMMSLSAAAIMLYTAPAIVTVLGILLFKESFQIKKILALFLAFAGCVLVTGVLTNAGTITPVGILLGFGSGFGYAMYSIFGHIAVKKGYESATVSVYTFLFGAVGSLFMTDGRLILKKIVKSPKALLPIAGLILFGTILAYVFYTIGLKYMEAGKASILASVEPVVASLIGFFLYKERMDLSMVLGVILVLFSAGLVNMPVEKKKGEKK